MAENSVESWVESMVELTAVRLELQKVDVKVGQMVGQRADSRELMMAEQTVEMMVASKADQMVDSKVVPMVDQWEDWSADC